MAIEVQASRCRLDQAPLFALSTWTWGHGGGLSAGHQCAHGAERVACPETEVTVRLPEKQGLNWTDQQHLFCQFLMSSRRHGANLGIDRIRVQGQLLVRLGPLLEEVPVLGGIDFWSASSRFLDKVQLESHGLCRDNDKWPRWHAS